MINSNFDIRWQQRFQNLSLAQKRFLEALQAHHLNPENILYQMALIQAFEFTYELCWKTLKDYLDYNGVKANTPRDVLKQAFAFGLISDGQVWINMLEDRNMMAHAYDDLIAKKAVEHIQVRYAPAIESLHQFLLSKYNTNE